MKLFVWKLFVRVCNLILHNGLIIYPLVQEWIFEQILESGGVIGLGLRYITKSLNFFGTFVELRSRKTWSSLNRVFKILSCQHFVVIWVLLVQKLILTQRQLQMIIEILDNNAVKHWIWVILQHIEISSKRHQISFNLCSDILSNTPGANAISRAVVAVPVLVFKDFRKVIFIVGAQAKCAEFSVAFVVYIFLLFTIFHIMIWIKFRKQIWKKLSQLSGQL